MGRDRREREGDRMARERDMRRDGVGEMMGGDKGGVRSSFI